MTHLRFDEKPFQSISAAILQKHRFKAVFSLSKYTLSRISADKNELKVTVPVSADGIENYRSCPARMKFQHPIPLYLKRKEKISLACYRSI
jgi:hypothetical protein